MAVVVIGGQMRGVGKTSVVCSLIGALRESDWMAVKVSTHGHSDIVEVIEQKSAGNETDSARYMAAGAARSFFISAPEGKLWRALPSLLDVLAEARNAIVESTSVMDYLQPEVAVAVIDPAAKVMKRSLQKTMGRFHASVTAGDAPLTGALQELAAKPRFVVLPPVYGSAELTAFVVDSLKQ